MIKLGIVKTFNSGPKFHWLKKQEEKKKMKPKGGEIHISLFDMILCLSTAMDLISPAVVDHHKRVAYIAFTLAGELGLTEEEQIQLLTAGALHDIGALSLQERLRILDFEIASPHKHAEAGYLLLKEFEPFSKIVSMIRYHHVPWNGGQGSELMEKQVPIGSYILHLADRVDVLINRQDEVLGQVQWICERIESYSKTVFMPELVKVFTRLAAKESFWFDVVFPSISQVLERKVRATSIELDLDGLLDLAKLFSRIIDFRSRFTAVHSSGVAASSEALAKFYGFSQQECQMMRIAGYLHDLGKLAVPPEILESQSKLGEDEIRVIKSHTFYTCRILETINGLDVINAWASLHHERLRGQGYPFHFQGEELSLGSRIMAVADVFTAVAEERPYRKGMGKEEALEVLKQMGETSKLDSEIVSTLALHYDEIDSIRMVAQSTASNEYEEYSDKLNRFSDIV